MTCSENSLYDKMRDRKVYIRKGMDCYTEFEEGVPMVRRALISKNDPHRMGLDEWASEVGVSVSGLIEMLGSAMYVYERAEVYA